MEGPGQILGIKWIQKERNKCALGKAETEAQLWEMIKKRKLQL